MRFCLFLKYNLAEHCISTYYAKQWFDISRHFKMIPMLSSLQSVIQRYYLIIDYIPHIVQFHTYDSNQNKCPYVWHLFSKQKFVPSPFLFFEPLFLSVTYLFFVNINVFLFCSICLYFCFRIPHVNELIKYLSFSDFCHLASLWSIQVIKNDKISLFYDWVIHTHTHTHHIFLQSSIGGNLGCLHISATVNNTVNISYSERSSAYIFLISVLIFFR